VPERDQPTTRRALLVAAAGGAAALAAHAALPGAALANDPNDVTLGETKSAGATTGITSNAAAADVLSATALDPNTASGVVGSAAHGAGIRAHSSEVAGLIGTSMDTTGAAPLANTAATGVYGWAPTPADPNTFGTGVWGDSDDVGVYGSAGAVGVEGDGNYGVLGRGFGTGGAGVVGQAVDTNTFGVFAQGDNATKVALRVSGKASFSRSGRTAMAAGTYYKVIYLSGVTTGSLVFAVLQANRTGRWVRAVLPATGRFIVYLNTTLTATTYVAWFVLN
jgi:hypothetical protein